MSIKKIILFIMLSSFLFSCAEYSVKKGDKKKERQYYSSSGFALIYDDDLYLQKILNKKINNDDIRVMHNILKPNTPVIITNPTNSKIVKTKVYKRANYPKIFNIVISKKIAQMLEIDPDNPFVELNEIKKNKTFVAKKSNTFDEEKNVAEVNPVEEVEMNILSQDDDIKKEELIDEQSFILVISDFYFEDTAKNLMNELIEKTGFNNILVKKVNNKKYRLFAGPFKNFNTLKNTYISLNKLGFENLNIYRD
tara:strand:- start:593 stop:1348 length:756 start_codon:yes stop_codon:yes gene_type:complete